MRTWLVGLVGLSAACGADRILVPPITPHTEAALIAANSRPVLAHAVRVLDGAAARLELPERTEEVPLLVSLFECPLEAVGLPAGALAVREGSGRPFPEGDRVLRWSPSEVGWEELPRSALDEALPNLRLDEPGAPVCNDFPLRLGPVQHSLPPRGGPQTLVSFANEWALAASAVGVFWIRPDLSIAPVQDPLLESEAVTILATESDEALIVASQGPVLLARPPAPLRVYADGPPNAGAPMSVVRSPSTADATELYVLSATGLTRYDGQSWTQLDTTLRTPDESARPGGLWLRPDHAVFLAPDSENGSRLIRWRDGVLDELPLPDLPRSLVQVPGLGVVVGTEGGQVLRVDTEAARAERIDGWSRPMRPIWVALPLEASVLLGGWSGLMNELLWDGRFCDGTGFTEEVLGASVGVAATVGPGREILAGGLAGEGTSSVRFVVFRLGRDSSPPRRCPE